MPRPEPASDFDRKLFANIDRFGLSVLAIAAGDEGPGFSYTVGLFETHGHPEIILIGLPRDSAHGILNGIGSRVAAGERFGPGVPTEGVIGRFPVWFTPVAAGSYRDYLGFANWFYRGTDYPAIQCVYPDNAGRFQWEPGANPRLADNQPLIGPTPEGSP